MRNMLLAAVAAVAIAPAAFANGGQIAGVVTPECEVEDLFATQTFASITAGATIVDGMTLVCNDADGAEVVLRSSEGGLESDDFEDLEIEYVATLDWGGTPLVLDTAGAFNNDVQVSATIPGSMGFVNGLSADLTIVLSDDAAYAGGYSDTIFVDLLAQ